MQHGAPTPNFSDSAHTGGRGPSYACMERHVRSDRGAPSDGPAHSKCRRVTAPQSAERAPLGTNIRALTPWRRTTRTLAKRASAGRRGSHHGERHDGQHARHRSQHLRGVRCRVARPHCAACGQQAFHRSARSPPLRDHTTSDQRHCTMWLASQHARRRMLAAAAGCGGHVNTYGPPACRPQMHRSAPATRACTSAHTAGPHTRGGGRGAGSQRIC